MAVDLISPLEIQSSRIQDTLVQVTLDHDSMNLVLLLMGNINAILEVGNIYGILLIFVQSS
jgi:hypothetical protein